MGCPLRATDRGGELGERGAMVGLGVGGGGEGEEVEMACDPGASLGWT